MKALEAANAIVRVNTREGTSAAFSRTNGHQVHQTERRANEAVCRLMNTDRATSTLF